MELNAPVSTAALSVAARLEVLEALRAGPLSVWIWGEKRVTTANGAPASDAASNTFPALYLKGSPVEHHHLAVQIGEGAEPEIAVLQMTSLTSLSKTPATKAPEVET